MSDYKLYIKWYGMTLYDTLYRFSIDDLAYLYADLYGHGHDYIDNIHF